MKAPFTVKTDKIGNRGIFNGTTIIKYQPFGTETDPEERKKLDDDCLFWNSAWEHGFAQGVLSETKKKEEGFRSVTGRGIV